jgi:rod shape-determining protein MreD
VRLFGVVSALVAALLVQTTVARFVVGGPISLDLVLVVVVFAGLRAGPVTGLLAGTAGGLIEDALSSGVIGIGGLAKTVVGFLAGVIGTQFIVAQSGPRFVVFACATALHALLFVGAYEVLDLRDFARPGAGLAIAAIGNAVVGVLAFRVVDLLPGAVERRKASRPRLQR